LRGGARPDTLIEQVRQSGGGTTTVHFIYPHGRAISCPDAIGRNVGERLRTRYRVVHYDWDDTRVIEPGPNEVLLGHPHPVAWTCFRQSARRSGWRRIIWMSPYNHGDLHQLSFGDSVIEYCDAYLAITGNYWFSSIPQSPFSHWLPRMVHVDLAVDRSDFPVMKNSFNRPGARRFLYIGHAGWPKNTEYLTQIAQAMPEGEVSWAGRGDRAIPGLKPLGYQDFRTEAAKRLVREHDFLLTVSHADSNPATVLEAMAWGLIPVCTAQSGYASYEGIRNIPLRDVGGALEVLRKLQHCPEESLRSMQQVNWEVLDTHFNWDRLAGQVIAAIESCTRPPLECEPLSRKLQLRWAALRSPHAPFSRRYLRVSARALFGFETNR